MTGKTHMLGGVLAAELCMLAAGERFIQTPQLIMAATAMIFSLTPDLDHPNSRVSKSSVGTKFAASAISAFAEHRGITHSLPAIAATALFGNVLSGKIAAQYSHVITEGIIIGLLSHLILDSFNPGGIAWLYPVSKERYHIASIKVNSGAESLFALALLILCALIGRIFTYSELFTFW